MKYRPTTPDQYTAFVADMNRLFNILAVMDAPDYEQDNTFRPLAAENVALILMNSAHVEEQTRGHQETSVYGEGLDEALDNIAWRCLMMDICDVGNWDRETILFGQS